MGADFSVTSSLCLYVSTSLLPTLHCGAAGLQQVQGLGASDADGAQTIAALCPASELGRYAADLRSLTGGRGRFSVTFDHYAELPAHLADKLEKRKAAAS